MQTNIKLPSCLEDFIFSKLQAKYEPNYSKFSKNLDLNEEEVKIYLGTYFPRSYAESYCIYNDLLHNQIIKEIYSKKTEINILDIGSGSGGNLIGLLFALKENLFQNININIFTIDGNQKALEILNTIIFKIQIKHNLNINPQSQFITFNSIDKLYQNSKLYLEKNYDFIITSKMINELLENDNNAYYNFCKYFTNHLSEDGFLSLIDVTMQVNSKFLPIILNTQINKFMKDNNSFKTIIPTSCNLYEDKCKEQCFTNNIFYVSHKEKQNDMSKITYRVITHNNFANKILSEITIGGLVGETQLGNKYCCHMDKNLDINAFKVQNEME